MIDLFALIVVAGTAGRGWQRGTVPMALWGISLVAGSVAAAVLARPAGAVVGATFSLSPLLAYPLAGFAVAALATAVARLATRRVGRGRAARAAEGWSPSWADRVGGATIGMALGMGLALFGGWVATSLGPAMGREADVRSSLVARLAGRIAEPVVRVVAGQATGDVVMASTFAYVMSDPPEAKRTIAALTTDIRIRELAGDSSFRMALASGDVGSLTSSPILASLASDEEFVTAARRVRLLDTHAGPVSAAEIADAAARRIGPTLRAMEELGADPTVRRLLDQMGLGDALERGDVSKLLADPRLAEVMERLSEKLREAR